MRGNHVRLEIGPSATSDISTLVAESFFRAHGSAWDAVKVETEK